MLARHVSCSVGRDANVSGYLGVQPKGSSNCICARRGEVERERQRKGRRQQVESKMYLLICLAQTS